MTAVRRAAFWLAPPLVCLALYWPGLLVFFQQDDFAWLGLRYQVRDVETFLWATFSPMAQGTIRPLSERLFFMTFSSLFGLDPLPFRIGVFLTQFANLALLGLIAQRLTGLRAAGLLAPVFWLANAGLAVAMSWTSAYNQILCGFFMLLGFYLLLRHIETGRTRFLAWQWAAFLLGFGALEIMVVYPALAGAYTLCCARPFFRKTLPMFGVSAVYTGVHTWAAPEPTGVYALHFDGSILQTLWTYWSWALGPQRLALFMPLPRWFTPVATVALTAGLLGFVVWMLVRKRCAAVLLPLAWFVGVLLPVLPLRDHISDYYLTIPAAGLALLGAWAVAYAWRHSWRLAVPAVLLAAIYFATAAVATHRTAAFYYQRGEPVRRLLAALARARQIHPGKAIVLTGVGNDLFWAGIRDKSYRLVGIPDIYLAPGVESSLHLYEDFSRISGFFLPPEILAAGVESESVVVYDASGDRLRNVTRAFSEIARARWKPGPASRVDLGEPLFSFQLGEGWHQAEDGYRWMARHATVKLLRPGNPNAQLYLSGYCPEIHLREGPLELRLTADGRQLPSVFVTRPDRFDVSVPLPVSNLRREDVVIALESGRTYTPPGDKRELGLAFISVEIR